MKIEVLVSSLNKDPRELIKRMKITGDAIIVNQCDKNDYEEIKTKKGLARVYYFNERGVGLSRNTALMRAKADIVLFADDDEVLVDNYDKLIISEFARNKKIDMVVFEIAKTNCDRPTATIKNRKRVGYTNSLIYGAVRFAVKTSKLRLNNINYSLLFGGGAKYGSGEDSIFIYDCIKKKLNIYTSPLVIATLDFSDSSWFKGYDEKFFSDRGALFYHLFGRLSPIFIFLILLKNRNKWGSLSFRNKYSLMYKGFVNEKNDG